jgi:hypothetical protein
MDTNVGETDRTRKRTFMNHRADSQVWQVFLAALTEKYNRNFWLICNRCLKRLVRARIPAENRRRRENEYRDLLAFKAAYLYKAKHGEIHDPMVKQFKHTETGDNGAKEGPVFYEWRGS